MCWVFTISTDTGERGSEADRSQNGTDSKWGPGGTCQDVPRPSPYRDQAPGPPEVQVDALARLVEMSLHILLPETQECVHANVEATLRLLQDKKQGRKHRGVKPGQVGRRRPGLENFWFPKKVSVL